MFKTIGCQKPAFLTKTIITVIIVGLITRYVLGYFLSYNYDIQSWALIISNIESGSGLYDLAGYNYAPPWGYALGFLSEIIGLLGVDVFGVMPPEAIPLEDYTEWFFTSYITSLKFNLAVKTMLFTFDLLAGYLIWWIVRNLADDKKAEYAFGLWFLCPFVIAVSAVGGMFDALSAILTLSCIIFVIRDRYYLAGILMGIVALMKLFPGILIFLLVAYIFIKSEDRQSAVKRTIQSVIGVLIALAVLLIPPIMSGDLSNCFAFLTSRATDNIGSGLGAIERYGTIIAYLCIIALAILISVKFLRGEKQRSLPDLFAFVLLTLAVLFLYPATPQYILLITPFIIIQMIIGDGKYRTSFFILCLGTTMFALSSNAVNLMSLGIFSDLISVDSIWSAIEAFQTPFLGINGMMILYYGGAVIQYIGTLSILATFFKSDKGKNNTRTLSIMNG